MPLFDLQCKNCNFTREIYFKKTPSKFRVFCINCRKKSTMKMMAPLVSMQPDNMWSGVKTEHGYFTSKSQYLNNLRENNLETITSRSDFETVRKNVAKAKVAKKEKAEKNLINHLTNELKGVTIDPDGNTVKERNRYVRTRSTK